MLDHIRKTVAIAQRSAAEARALLGPGMWIVLPATLVVAFISVALNGFEWDWLIVLTAAISYPVLFALAFAAKWCRNIRHADLHDEWLAKEPIVMPGPNPIIVFAIRSKVGTPYLQGQCCRVRHPNGKTYEALDETPGGGHTFLFHYPTSFADAPPPISGTYEIVWRLPGASGKFREILRHEESINIE